MDWFIVWFNLKRFEKKGLKIKFHDYLNLDFKKLSSIVGIDYRIVSEWFNSNRKTLFKFLEKLRTYADFIVWFDTTDSTGTTQFEVLSFVDRYLKKQLLKDSTLYQEKSFLRSRIYTDFFYAKKYNLSPEKKDKEGLERGLLPKGQKNKIKLSWNIGLCNYSTLNLFYRILYGLVNKNKINFTEPSKERKLNLAANFNSNYSSKLISFQRKMLLKTLNEKIKDDFRISTGLVPKDKFLNNLKNAQSILSPFGWGEICYRDFETFISGAALIKPSVEHLKTWPDFYLKNKTYIPLSWEFRKWEKELTDILDNPHFLFKVAKNGQDLYKSIWTEKKQKEFCRHFIEIITPN